MSKKVFPTETLMLATQMRNVQKEPGNIVHSKQLDILQNHLSQKPLTYSYWYTHMICNEFFHLKTLIAAIVSS